MLSNTLERLSNSVLASNSSLTSNLRDPSLNVTDYQSSNSMAPSSIPNITGEFPETPSKDIVLTSASCGLVQVTSETQVSRNETVQASATTLSLSETKVPRNECAQASASTPSSSLSSNSMAPSSIPNITGESFEAPSK